MTLMVVRETVVTGHCEALPTSGFRGCKCRITFQILGLCAVVHMARSDVIVLATTDFVHGVTERSARKEPDSRLVGNCCS